MSTLEEMYAETNVLKKRHFNAAQVPITVPTPKIQPDELRRIIGLMDGSVPTEFQSHRKYIGPILVFIKSTIARSMSPFLRVAFKRQFQLNHYIWALSFEILELRNDVANLKSELSQLKKQS